MTEQAQADEARARTLIEGLFRGAATASPSELAYVEATFAAVREEAKAKWDAVCNQRDEALALAQEMKDKYEAARAAEAALENERQKVAGCSTAAVGAWKEGDTLALEYECAAIHDVAALYARMERAEAEKEAIDDDRHQTFDWWQEEIKKRQQAEAEVGRLKAELAIYKPVEATDSGGTA